jgi:magnesium-transporting ATPase (P-type)
MFKQVKSAFFWYYLYKFRRRVILITFLLLISLFSNAIYSDVVQYLTLKEKLEYLEVLLLTKWLIIIFNLLLSVYLILTIFKSNEKENIDKKEKKKEKNNDIIGKKEKEQSKFSSREEEFLNKDFLNNKADSLVKR